MAEVLPLGQMSRRLRVPRDWLRTKADIGAIPCLKAGKRYFFNATEAMEAMAVLASRKPRSDKIKAGVQGDPDAGESTIGAEVGLGAVQDNTGPQAAVCVDE